ncbi:MAG: CoA pyrophosphatase [Planctomycetales bacterium]|nr:CoA pyrophosphatase [Planctomycetales bacterium]
MDGAPTFEEAAARIRSAPRVRASRRLSVPGFAPAAVLVPVLRRPVGPSVLFTERTREVAHHKGQVSFPGGALEPGEDPVAGALREAREEVGLEPARVEVLGTLDDQPSVSRFVVTPVLGLVADPPPVFVGDPREVAEPFEVPLATLLDRSRFRAERWGPERMPPGAPVRELLALRESFEEYDPSTSTYQVYFFDAVTGRAIWGLTARILKGLLDRAFGFSG